MHVRSAMYQVHNLSLLSLSDSPSNNSNSRCLREQEMVLVAEAGVAEEGCRTQEVEGALVVLEVVGRAILARSAKSSQIAHSSTLEQELGVSSNHKWGCLRSITTMLLEAPTAIKPRPCHHPLANPDNKTPTMPNFKTSNNELKHAQTLQDHLLAVANEDITVPIDTTSPSLVSPTYSWSIISQVSSYKSKHARSLTTNSMFRHTASRNRHSCTG